MLSLNYSARVGTNKIHLNLRLCGCIFCLGSSNFFWIGGDLISIVGDLFCIIGYQVGGYFFQPVDDYSQLFGIFLLSAAFPIDFFNGQRRVFRRRIFQLNGVFSRPTTILTAWRDFLFFWLVHQYFQGRRLLLQR